MIATHRETAVQESGFEELKAKSFEYQVFQISNVLTETATLHLWCREPERGHEPDTKKGEDGLFCGIFNISNIVINTVIIVVVVRCCCC